jgi:hypothetical protein
MLCLDSSRTRLIGGRLPIPLWFLTVLWWISQSGSAFARARLER